MAEKQPHIQWAPRLRRSRLYQIYKNDALGAVDEELIAAVGFDLLQRCRSILMVSSARELDCPRCGLRITSPQRWSRERPILCPSCGWSATYGQFRDSWRKQDLIGGNAVRVFQSFVDSYPAARSAAERMVLIDQLIHAFHSFNKGRTTGRPVAGMLIEGSFGEVMEFLDRLSYGDRTTPALEATHKAWKETLYAVVESFPFMRAKLEVKKSDASSPDL